MIKDTLGFMYQTGTAIHRSVYEIGVIRQTKLAIPVIGVGNLSFGGSGKTVVVQALAEKLAAEGMKVGIVCRSYGASAGPHILSESNCDPAVVGDEAAMLWSAGGVSVVSARDKTEAAMALVKSAPAPDVILVDDAFQHHKLHQDIKLLIWPKPSALLRDFCSSADLADILLVPNGMRSPWPDDRTVYFVKEIVRFNPPVSSPVLVAAGLGPETDFFGHVRKLSGAGEIRELRLPDHVDYRNPRVQADLLNASRGCAAVVTTAKDAVKLSRLALNLPPIYVVQVRAKFIANADWMWDRIMKIISHREHRG